ncbi:MAG: M1 family metallopeptidase [bacterium]|nr:M1 family metallopeptidase [bacterium]
MKNLFPILLLCLLAGCASTETRLSENRATIPRYEIEGTVDMTVREIRATADITIPHALITDEGLRIDLAGMSDEINPDRLRLKRITTGNRTWLPSDLTHDELGVLLPVASSPRDLRLAIEYTAPLRDGYKEDLGYDSFFATSRWSVWYPLIRTSGDDYPPHCDFTVQLDLPAGMQVLTSGREQKCEGRDERETRTWEATHASGFALNLADDHDLITIDLEGFRVTVLAPPDQHEEFAAAARLTARAMVWYRDLYGFFPVGQIGIAPGAPGYRGGFPAENLYYIHRACLDEDFLMEITAHELGHYFWGMYARSASRIDLDWVMLGMGIWADQLFLAQQRECDLDELWRNGEWMELYLKAVDKGVDQRLGITEEEEEVLEFDYNTYIRHAKGALGIFLEARKIGQERFAALQRRILAEYRDRGLSPEIMALLFEEAGIEDASAFFADWVGGDTSPDRFPREFDGLIPSTDPTQNAIGE